MGVGQGRLIHKADTVRQAPSGIINFNRIPSLRTEEDT